MRSVIRSPEAIGAAVREARRSIKLTQLELGRQTGLRQATISSVENGDGGTLESLFKILTVLKLDVHVVPRSTAHPELDELF